MNAKNPSARMSFYYKGGIAEFVKHLNKNKTTLHDKPLYFEKESDALSIEVAIQYNDGYDEKVYSFPTTSHSGRRNSPLGFRFRVLREPDQCLTRSRQAWRKNFKGSLTGDDVREGLVAVISVKLRSLS